MGQGQADLAIQMLKECARNGDWLCLKNLHLVISWLPVLEKVGSHKCGTNTFAQNKMDLLIRSHKISLFKSIQENARNY